MTIHLIKLSVGTDSVEYLAEVQRRRIEMSEQAGGPALPVHVTRMMPRRRDELLEGGSIYWVIKGQVRARQRLRAIEELVDEEGVRRCALVLDPELVRVVPTARRPHQGWRYLKAEDAPADLADVGGVAEGEEPPSELLAELKELGLL